MNLDLAPTKDLIEALSKRFESLVFVGQKSPSNEDPTTNVNVWRYKGNRFLCIGLAFNLIALMNEQTVELTDPLPPSEV